MEGAKQSFSDTETRRRQTEPEGATPDVNKLVQSGARMTTRPISAQSTNDLAGQTAALRLVEDGLPQREPARKRARNLSGEVESQISWADQVTGPETAGNAGTQDGRVIPAAEALWKQARGLFLASTKARLRADTIKRWGTEGLIPDWAIGHGTIPPHLLVKEWRTRFGDVVRQQGRELMDYLADTLLASAESFDKQANALLRSVKTLYAEDNDGYDNSVAKIEAFCKKDKQEQLKLLDRQRTSLLTTDQSAEAATNKRCPLQKTPTPINRGRQNQTRNNRAGTSNKRRRSSSNQRGRRSRSRSTSRRPDKDNEQELFNLFKKIAANVRRR